MSAPGNPMRDSQTSSEAAGKASFGRSLRMVAWGLLGVRKKSDHQRDLGQVNPLHVLVAALAALLVFVLVLVGIVNWVVPGASA